MPPTAKMIGNRYSIIFCCCANGPVSASGGMFLRISCSWVTNSVAVMARMSTTADRRASPSRAPPA